MGIVTFIKSETVNLNTTSKVPSPSLVGEPMPDDKFLTWIRKAEEMATISLLDAEAKWAEKRKQFHHPIK